MIDSYYIMAKLVVVGDPSEAAKYIDQYILENKFLPHEVERFSETLKIEDARGIVHQLGFSVRTQKMLVFDCTLSAAVQNALLKSVEECDDSVTFVFISASENGFLATLISRCTVITLRKTVQSHESFENLIVAAASKPQPWHEIDLMCETLKEENMETLLLALRKRIINDYQSPEILQYLTYIRKMLHLLPLHQNNNVNKNVVIESVFLN